VDASEDGDEPLGEAPDLGKQRSS